MVEAEKVIRSTQKLLLPSLTEGERSNVDGAPFETLQQLLQKELQVRMIYRVEAIDWTDIV